MKYVIGILGLTLLSAPASARDVKSLAFMEKACKAEAGSYMQGICVGRLDGFDVGTQAVGKATEKAPEEGMKALGICVPEGVTLEQKSRMLVKFAEDNPARLHEFWLKPYVDALKAAFGCKK